MEKMTFYNNSISLDEFQGDMDLSIFNSLLKYAEITLKSLGINTEGKLDFIIFNEGNIKETNVTPERINKLKQDFIYNPDFLRIM